MKDCGDGENDVECDWWLNELNVDEEWLSEFACGIDRLIVERSIAERWLCGWLCDGCELVMLELIPYEFDDSKGDDGEWGSEECWLNEELLMDWFKDDWGVDGLSELRLFCWWLWLR